jgi:hypothetical protein
MAFPIKVCVVCEEKFELKPDKPGFANRCPKCSSLEAEDDGPTGVAVSGDRSLAEARRKAMRDLLYRKDS